MWSLLKISINFPNWLSNLFFFNLCGYGAVKLSSLKRAFSSDFLCSLLAGFFSNFLAFLIVLTLFSVVLISFFEFPTLFSLLSALSLSFSALFYEFPALASSFSARFYALLPWTGFSIVLPLLSVMALQ